MAYHIAGGRYTVLDASGNPVSGAKVYTYEAGTLAPKTTYTTRAGGVANANPVVCGADGCCDIYVDGVTRLIEKTSADVAIAGRDIEVEPAQSAAGLASVASASDGAGLVKFDATLAYPSRSVGRRLVLDYWSPADYPWLAAFDGVTDDTAAINACATACRATTPRRAMKLPAGKAVISSSLNFSGITVTGSGRFATELRATSAQFDVVTTTNDTILSNLYIDGGWDGSTAGLTGDSISVKATSPSYPYNVHLDNLRIVNSKKRGIFVERGGYSSISRVLCNTSGLHGLELYGNSGSDATTTLDVHGRCVFSDTPNGYGVRLKDVVNVRLLGVISENTKGFEIAGNENRNLSINGCHQENTTVANFLTLTGSCIGMEMHGNYGVGFALPYSANFTSVEIGVDNNFDLPATAPEWLICRTPAVRSATGTESTTATTGGVNFTATSITLAPGIWQIQASMQTVNSAGATLVSAGFRLTSNVAENVTQTTGATFAADEVMTGTYGANAQSRPSLSVVYENTTGADQTYYMRGHINISAGTIAYKGFIRAVRIG